MEGGGIAMCDGYEWFLLFVACVIAIVGGLSMLV